MEFRYQIPTREDVAAVLRSLIQGHKTREEVSAWATEYIVFDDPAIYPEVEDEAVWEALEALTGANLISTDRPYLYGAEDFQNWLDELISSP